MKLFAFTLQKIALTDIEFADTVRPFWNEHGGDMFWVCQRIVRLRRQSGLMRNFIITPVDRRDILTSCAQSCRDEAAK